MLLSRSCSFSDVDDNQSLSIRAEWERESDGCTRKATDGPFVAIQALEARTKLPFCIQKRNAKSEVEKNV